MAAPVGTSAQNTSRTQVYYVAPPDTGPNAFAAFWHNFHLERNQWATQVFNARLAQLRPDQQYEVLVAMSRQLTELTKKIAELDSVGVESRADLTGDVLDFVAEIYRSQSGVESARLGFEGARVAASATRDKALLDRDIELVKSRQITAANQAKVDAFHNKMTTLQNQWSNAPAGSPEREAVQKQIDKATLDFRKSAYLAEPNGAQRAAIAEAAARVPKVMNDDQAFSVVVGNVQAAMPTEDVTVSQPNPYMGRSTAGVPPNAVRDAMDIVRMLGYNTGQPTQPAAAPPSPPAAPAAPAIDLSAPPPLNTAPAAPAAPPPAGSPPGAPAPTGSAVPATVPGNAPADGTANAGSLATDPQLADARQLLSTQAAEIARQMQEMRDYYRSLGQLGGVYDPLPIGSAYAAGRTQKPPKENPPQRVKTSRRLAAEEAQAAGQEPGAIYIYDPAQDTLDARDVELDPQTLPQQVEAPAPSDEALPTGGASLGGQSALPGAGIRYSLQKPPPGFPTSYLVDDVTGYVIDQTTGKQTGFRVEPVTGDVIPPQDVKATSTYTPDNPPPDLPGDGVVNDRTGNVDTPDGRPTPYRLNSKGEYTTERVELPRIATPQVPQLPPPTEVDRVRAGDQPYVDVRNAFARLQRANKAAATVDTRGTPEQVSRRAVELQRDVDAARRALDQVYAANNEATDFANAYQTLEKWPDLKDATMDEIRRIYAQWEPGNGKTAGQIAIDAGLPLHRVGIVPSVIAYLDARERYLASDRPPESMPRMGSEGLGAVAPDFLETAKLTPPPPTGIEREDFLLPRVRAQQRAQAMRNQLNQQVQVATDGGRPVYSTVESMLTPGQRAQLFREAMLQSLRDSGELTPDMEAGKAPVPPHVAKYLRPSPEELAEKRPAWEEEEEP